MKYYGKLTCTIDENHPDIEYVKDWTKDKILTFEDVYVFNNNYGYSKENIIDYIKHDLMLVAGGGYNTDHIHNVTLEVEKI